MAVFRQDTLNGRFRRRKKGDAEQQEHDAAGLGNDLDLETALFEVGGFSAAEIVSLSGASTFELPKGAISASVVVSTIPLLLLVILFQRRIIQGLTAGASKG